MAVACFASFYAFADVEIGDIGESVVTYLGLADGKIPMGHMYEEKQDLLGSRRDYYVFFGNKKFGPYQKTRWIQYISEKKQLSYWAKIDEKWYFFVGNEKQWPFDSLEKYHTSSYNDFKVYEVTYNKGRYLVSYKEKKGTHFKSGWGRDIISGVTILSDNTFFYESSRDVGYSERSIFIDGRKINNSNPILIASDGKTFAYNEHYSIYIGKKQLGPYRNYPHFLQFNPTNKTLAYSLEIENKEFIFNGRSKLGPFPLSV